MLSLGEDLLCASFSVRIRYIRVFVLVFIGSSLVYRTIVSLFLLLRRRRRLRLFSRSEVNQL